ncbi:histidine ammonia-lyase [Planifilum fulgidum]|jgi:histidine ammonia-lyase|uniref:Histidine ammonia-lyase n=1 Tax=Planifilum fulgidum TaxID=201973 RepID=A0A1I2SP16_9BACL|nr:histidine ammonia-lyase [Planifilum fulgidum]MBO2497955.1 histidine ammonia-lyase [Bacillota bacterium]MBO2533500.1 histidine ammonia-lyase [Thermoactinomycetaceae bacterium]SFG54510.1 histidine ammonia-lyase [Planifilum fulgidum]
MNRQPALVLSGEALTLEDFADAVFHRRPVVLDPKAIERMESSRRMVERLVLEKQIVYGITTGFGKFSDTVIKCDQSAKLQLNLIRSHACGVGEPLPEEAVRGMMLLRANALAKGFSGIRPAVVQRLVDLLNRGIHPCIPSQGSLGASGDLAPLAHMALPLLGKGEVWYRGERMPSDQALRLAGLSPVQLEAKEGLALINGTQMMTSLAALALVASKRLLLSADIIGAMTLEALGGIPQAFHPLLQKVRGHRGQIVTADNLRSLIRESQLVSRPGQKRVQDAYSLRCMPQVHGASKDAFRYVESVITREMNAATDNPLLFPEEDLVISGGNFHGQPVALAADFLAIALAELANISERRTERLVNPNLSGLPPFLTRRGGLHSGYMILQYVAASLVSENKTLCHPASVDSIPSSANQEDHVSMGAIGARKLQSVVHNVTRVLAIEYLCAAQALEFAGKTPGLGTRIAHRLLRDRVPPLTEDREGTPDIEEAARLIEEGVLVEKVRQAVPLTL